MSLRSLTLKSLQRLNLNCLSSHTSITILSNSMRHIQNVMPAAQHADFCWDQVQNKKAETFELKRLKGVTRVVRVSKLGHDLWVRAIKKVIRLLKIKHFKKRRREFEEITMPQFISILEMIMCRIEDKALLQVGVRVEQDDNDQRDPHGPCMDAIYRFYYGGSMRSLRTVVFAFWFRFISNFLIILNMVFVFVFASQIQRPPKPPKVGRLLHSHPGGGGGGGPRNATSGGAA